MLSWLGFNSPHLFIRAPISGVVGARLVFPGSSVKINETTLAVVNRPSPLLVSFSLFPSVT